MTRKAWLIWRSTPRGSSAAVHFDHMPGPDGRSYGGRILAAHELPAATVEGFEAGALKLVDLFACYPPPIEAEA